MFKSIFNKIFKSNVQDISFGNIFFKKFMTYLCVLLVITIPILFPVSEFVEGHYEQVLDGKFKQLALDLSTVYNSDLETFEKKTAANYLMASCVDEMQSNKFTTNASIALYDMTLGEILIRSSECPVIENSDLYLHNTIKDIKNGGLSSVSLDLTLNEFYHKHAGETIYIKRLYTLNGVIFPTCLVTLNDKYQETDSISINAPTIVTETTYDEPPILEIRGNLPDDVTLNLLSNFKFENIGTNDDGTNILNVSYPSITATTNLKTDTLQFEIDDVTYQIDCAYRVNFWNGALIIVLIAELLGVLLCAAFALWQTKETLNCMH